MSTVNEPLLLSRKEAAKVLGISVSTLDREKHDGKIPFVQMRGRVLFNPVKLKELTNQSKLEEVYKWAA